MKQWKEGFETASYRVQDYVNCGNNDTIWSPNKSCLFSPVLCVGVIKSCVHFPNPFILFRSLSQQAFVGSLSTKYGILCNANINKPYAEQIVWYKRDRGQKQEEKYGCKKSVQPFYPSANLRTQACEWRQEKTFLLCYRSCLSIKMHESFSAHSAENCSYPSTRTNTHIDMHTIRDTEAQTHNDNELVPSNHCCGHKIHTNKHSHYTVTGWIDRKTTGGYCRQQWCHKWFARTLGGCRETLQHVKCVCAHASMYLYREKF